MSHNPINQIPCLPAGRQALNPQKLHLSNAQIIKTPLTLALSPEGRGVRATQYHYFQLLIQSTVLMPTGAFTWLAG